MYLAVTILFQYADFPACPPPGIRLLPSFHTLIIVLIFCIYLSLLKSSYWVQLTQTSDELSHPK